MKEYFDLYRKIDEDIIEAISKESNNIDELIDLKEKHVSKISELGISREEFKKKYNELELNKLDDVVVKEFKNKLKEVKEEMIRLKKSNEMNNSYINVNRIGSIFSKLL